MLEVKDKTTLLNLKNHEENEQIKVVDEDKIYKFTDGEWKEYTPPEFKMSLYDMNKAYWATKDPLDDYGLTNAQGVVIEYIRKTGGEFYMLLNNDLRYYTLFQLGSPQGEATASQELMTLLGHFDDVKNISLTEAEDAIEIWATFNGELHMFMFFNYDMGVIKCK